jgi:hypothetical protein
LVAEVPGLTVDLLPQFHAALELQDRQWTLARRLYGMMPALPPPKYPLDDMREWQAEALARFLNITSAAQWRQELTALRGIWEAIRPKPEMKSTAPAPAAPQPGLFGDDALLKKYDFGRMRFRDQDECLRFVNRLRAVEKLFLESATVGLARNLLTTELQINRLDEALSVPENLGDEWRKSSQQRSKLMEDYNKLLALINDLAPWFGAIAGKYSFKGALAEVTEAIQQYQADGSHELVDGIFASTEIQVLLRRSVQAPDPQYRAGWVMHALAAKTNLWNPKWVNTIPRSVLQKLDRGFKEAIKAAGQETGETLPDLQHGGEYPPLETVSESKPA